MKRCPECRRDYHDDSLLYCLEDGAALVQGSVLPPDEPQTAILHSTDAPSEAATRGLLHTTAGEERLGPRAAGSASGRNVVIVGVLAILLLTALGIGGYWLYGRGPKQIDSIAVLPFENRSGNPDTEYLSDGLTDSLIFRFSQLPNVKVSPTSSVMRYKGVAKDVADIARELDVDAVLSGRLMQVGDNLSVSVQLIDARTKKLVWAEQYDRKIADLLATQREIATTLTEKLQLRLTGEEKGIAKKYTSSNDAYQLYLKGRYHWSRRTREDLLKAIEHYKQAIALDPNFALAYAATAEVYNSMGKNPDAAPKDCIPLAKAAAQRALEIDPTLAQAHSALADSLALYDWDWAASELHFKKAIELDPNVSYTYVAYSGYLQAQGKADEAVTALEKSVALEPQALINNCILTTTYLYARKFDRALTQGRATYDLDANFPFAPQWLGFALIANGKYDEAISVAKRVPPDAPFAWISYVVLGRAYAVQGKRTEAEQEIARIREVGKSRYIRPYFLALIYAALNDKDKAFTELERSFDERDCYLGRMRVDPFLDPLREDPRFNDLLKRMGLSN